MQAGHGDFAYTPSLVYTWVGARRCPYAEWPRLACIWASLTAPGFMQPGMGLVWSAQHVLCQNLPTYLVWLPTTYLGTYIQYLQYIGTHQVYHQEADVALATADRLW